MLLAAATVYFGGRLIVEGSESRATRNARRLIDLEQSLGIDVEHSVQQFALDHRWFEVLGNQSYVWLHWPLLLAVLAVLFRTDSRHYRQVRNALFVSGALGLVLFATLPMSPPRFMPGFVGTVSDEARRHYLNYPLSWSNRFAAFPSFHVGWTLIACLAFAASLHARRAQVVALAPGVLVGVAVVSTGNHYILDSLAGAAIALSAYVYFGHHEEERARAATTDVRRPERRDRPHPVVSAPAGSRDSGDRVDRVAP